jgi:hypothetical protein
LAHEFGYSGGLLASQMDVEHVAISEHWIEVLDERAVALRTA